MMKHQQSSPESSASSRRANAASKKRVRNREDMEDTGSSSSSSGSEEEEEEELPAAPTSSSAAAPPAPLPTGAAFPNAAALQIEELLQLRQRQAAENLEELIRLRQLQALANGNAPPPMPSTNGTGGVGGTAVLDQLLLAEHLRLQQQQQQQQQAAAAAALFGATDPLAALYPGLSSQAHLNALLASSSIQGLSSLGAAGIPDLQAQTAAGSNPQQQPTVIAILPPGASATPAAAAAAAQLQQHQQRQQQHSAAGLVPPYISVPQEVMVMPSQTGTTATTLDQLLQQQHQQQAAAAVRHHNTDAASTSGATAELLNLDLQSKGTSRKRAKNASDTKSVGSGTSWGDTAGANSSIATLETDEIGDNDDDEFGTDSEASFYANVVRDHKLNDDDGGDKKDSDKKQSKKKDSKNKKDSKAPVTVTVLKRHKGYLSSLKDDDSETERNLHTKRPINSSAWGKWDVPMGRRQEVRLHEGNTRFREWVDERRPAYQATDRKGDKTRLAKEIYKLVISHGGRFLDEERRKRTDPKTGNVVIEYVWVPIESAKAQNKISQALRTGTRHVKGAKGSKGNDESEGEVEELQDVARSNEKASPKKPDLKAPPPRKEESNASPAAKKDKSSEEEALQAMLLLNDSTKK